jgi:hypothetical protein
MNADTVNKAIELQSKLKEIDEYLKTINVKVNCGNYCRFQSITGINQHENETRLTENIKNQLRKVRNALQIELDKL